MNVITSVVVVVVVRSAGCLLSQVRHLDAVLQDLLCGLHNRYVRGWGGVEGGGGSVTAVF